jgi:cytochrome c biogenesis protein CcdA
MKPLFISLFLFLSYSAAAIMVTPNEWDFGTLESDGGLVSQVVQILNNSDREITVTLISTCGCLAVDPAMFKLQAGESGAVTLFFNPVDEKGLVEKDMIILSTLPGFNKALFLVHGEVLEALNGKKGGAEEFPAALAAGRVVQLQYYYSPGCKSCLRFLKHSIPELEKKVNLKIEVARFDILKPEVYEDFHAMLADLGVEEKAFPALFIGAVLLQGDREIAAKLEGELLAFAQGKGQGQPGVAATEPGHREQIGAGLAVLPILLAGLLDGVNPCAFAAMIFLISSLALAGRSRRETLCIGIFFTAAVFLTYYLIGLGLFQGLRAASVFPIIALIIKWALIGALLLLSGLSLYDYFIVRSGRSSEIVLQLPRFFKLKIHETIRKRVRTTALIGGSLMLGVLVSIFELACTGQVYFPVIAYLVRLGKDPRAYLYLLLYNTGFVVPLLLVFLLIYFGISSGVIVSFFQRSIRLVKLGLAFLFLTLAVITFLI